MKKRSTYVLIAVASAATTVFSAQSGSKTAAVVNGEIITEEQVLAAAAEAERQRPPGQSLGAREKLEAMHNALDSIVETKLIAAEAVKLHTTPRQIVEAEIESNVAVPSDEQVQQYYERNRSTIAIAREQALPQIRQRLTELSRTTYRNALLRRLKREYGFRSYLEPLRTEVATAGHASRGPANAPVTIVEFADFQCPFCGALFPTLNAIEKAYPDKVRVVYRHFPLTNIHPYAQKAAEAAVCAGEQGHFWEMHDSLFRLQADLGVASLKRRAQELRLDTTTFNACLDSGKTAANIKQDVTEAAKAGVNGTPTLFVNGRILLGNQPAELRAMIEDELERAAKK